MGQQASGFQTRYLPYTTHTTQVVIIDPILFLFFLCALLFLYYISHKFTNNVSSTIKKQKFPGCTQNYSYFDIHLINTLNFIYGSYIHTQP